MFCSHKAKRRYKVLSLFIFCLFLQANSQCQKDRYLHIRRHLAWSPSASHRLEAELKSIEENQAILSINIIRYPNKQILAWKFQGKKIDELAQMYMQRNPKAEKRLSAWLKEWPFPKTINKKDLPLERKTSTSRATTASNFFFLPKWHWGSEKRKPSPLLQYQRSLKMKGLSKLWLRFRKNYKGESNLLLLETKDHKHQWPFRSRAPYPTLAQVRQLNCFQENCLLEIEYDSRQRKAARSTYFFFFRPKFHAARFYNSIGYQQHEQKKYSTALKSFSKAHKLAPNYHNAAYNYSCTLALLGKHQDAMLQLKKIIKKDKSFHKLACKDKDFHKTRKTHFWKAQMDCSKKHKGKIPTTQKKSLKTLTPISSKPTSKR